MTNLTKLDKQILEILFQDARTPIAEIAALLREPASTVRGRLRRLETTGIITGYRPILNPKLLGYDIQAVIQIQRDSNGQIDALLPHLEKLPSVVNLIHPLGNIDGLITVWAKNIAELAQIIGQINDIPDIVRTETLVVLNEKSFLPLRDR
ncbi:MAG: Lrp/AsnC family transcriptional regulator [Chloroflexota bacterium]